MKHAFALVLTFFWSVALLVATVSPCGAELPGEGGMPPNERCIPPPPEFLLPKAHFSRVSLDQGLPNSEVRALLQDSRGFMWIGTPGGLTRYDGYECRTFRSDPNTPASLGGDRINVIKEGPDGALWVSGSPGMITRYDPKSESFTRFPIRLDKKEIESFSNLIMDESGIVWLGGGENGLIRFDPQTGETKVISADAPVWSMDMDARGDLWFTTNNGLFHLEKGGKEADHMCRLRTGPSSVRVDSLGNIWIAAHSLQRFIPENGKVREYLISNAPIYSMLMQRGGDIWLGTRNGIYVFDPAKEEVKRHFTNSAKEEGELLGERILCLYEDIDGVMWSGSFNEGVQLYDPRQERFQLLKIKGTVPRLMLRNVVCDILGAGDGRVWLGREGAISLVNLDSRVVEDRTPREWAFLPHRTGGMYLDDKGFLWVGTRGHVARIGRDPGEDRVYALSPGNVEDPPVITDIVQSGDFMLLTTIHKGMAILDPDTGEITFLKDGTPGFNSQALVQGSDAIWAAGPGGVARVLKGRDVWSCFEAPWEEVYTLLPARKGDVWVGASNGLFRWSRKTQTCESWSVQDGLPAPGVLAILEDLQGRLWMSVGKNLVLFVPESGDMRVYNAGDGLSPVKFLRDAAWSDSQGRMFFGSMDGMVVFTPDQITDTPSKARVVATSFSIHDHEVRPGPDSPLKTPIWNAEKIVLKHDQRILTFEFALLSFPAPEQTRYRYRLEGFDPQWIVADATGRLARYMALPAGEYTLRARAMSGGAWSRHEATLAITVLPPWWDTPFFKFCVVLSLLAMTYLVFRARVNAIRRRNVLLEYQVGERTRELAEVNRQLMKSKAAAEAANKAKSAFLANMSHELRTPLNAILGFADLIRRNASIPANELENLSVIKRSGDHLLSLINQVLDLSKIEADRMTLNVVDCDLEHILRDVRNLISDKAREKSVSLELTCAADTPKFIRLDAVKLKQVLINLMDNAVKFTEKGSVSLLVEPEGDGALRFEVRDTGVGVSKDEMDKLFELFAQTESGRKSSQGTGLGLPLSRRLVRLMGGDMEVESEPGKGTAISFMVQVEEGDASTQEEEAEPRRVKGLAPGQAEVRVLIADDNEENRDLVLKLLTPMGFSVRAAADGREAVDLWRSWNPRFILMDMRMPVMDGYEATRIIKAEGGDRVRVVAFSASSFQSERQIALDAGCDDYLRKPMRTRNLFSMLERLLGVEFLYEDTSEERASASGPDLAREVTPEALRDLSPELLGRLRRAVDEVDLDLALEIIRDIEYENERLAAGLGHLAETYRFDLIQQALD